MIAVNGNFYQSQDVHVQVLLGSLLERLRDGFDPARWEGLRISQLRVITAVPPEGISITALADRVGMTKQGCGQFVTGLVETGHLDVHAPPEDRRLRLVFRTRAGYRIVARQARHMESVEAAWAAEVGPRRFATFLRVLEELAFGGARAT